MFFRAAVIVVLALVAGACSADASPSSPVALDGSPRLPDAEGVVVKASAKGLTLNRDRTYKVSAKLVAFSTYNLKPITLASTVNDFVQLGLDGDTVVWIARIGLVQGAEGGKRIALYQGELTKAKGARLYFKDGTVLRLKSGLRMPDDARGLTTAHIDADRGVVEGAVFPPATPTTTRPQNS